MNTGKNKEEELMKPEINNVTIQREIITPELASAYLATSPGNRPINKERLNAIIKALNTGRYMSTVPNAIAFDEKGRLRDGHHRLTAIAQTGQTASLWVARNVPEEAMSFIDVNKPRTPHEHIIMSDVFAGDVALRHQKMPTVVREVLSNELGIQYWTNEQMVRVMDFFKNEIHKLYDVACAKQKSLTPSVAAAALAAILDDENECDLDGFFEIFCKGNATQEGYKNTSIAFNWRNQILAAKARKQSFSKAALYYGTQNAIWHYCRNDDVRTVRQMNNGRYNIKPLVVDLAKSL